MSNITFRPLRAEEIEVRLSRCTKSGAFFLLYKDARCDMNILDETVGSFNWQRKHDDHHDNLFCSVGVNAAYQDPTASPVWVWKEDAGSESNTEAEKGHASDSFKRACFNWGIGRELYTKINIFLPGITKESEKRANTYELKNPFLRLHVSDIVTRDGKIVRLVLSDKDDTVAFQWGEAPKTQTPPPTECTDCGCVISDYIDPNGKRVDADRVVASSIGRFKVPLCVECASKRAALEKVKGCEQ